MLLIRLHVFGEDAFSCRVFIKHSKVFRSFLSCESDAHEFLVLLGGYNIHENLHNFFEVVNRRGQCRNVPSELCYGLCCPAVIIVLLPRCSSTNIVANC